MATVDHWLFALKLLAVLGCGLVAGIFFAFSSFVMAALARIQAPQGIAAMQSINITVINPLFMTAFLGTGVVCFFLAIAALFKWHQPSAGYVLIGSLLYMIGTVGVTIVGNVPLNDELAKVDPNSIDGANRWANYLANWTVWNHVRTIAALAAAASLTIAVSK
jgi:uncharacterized membrane protein